MTRIKKYTPLITLLVGLGLGYLIFSDFNHPEEHASKTIENSVYTCSMHPQIRQNKPGKCPICAMDLIPVSGSGESENPALEITEAAQALAKIQTLKVQRSDLKKTLFLPGELKVNASKQKRWSVQFSGRVERLHRKGNGELVQKGEVLMEIYSPELSQMHRELLEAKRLNNDELVHIVQTRIRLLDIDDKTIDALTAASDSWEVFPVKALESGMITSWEVSEKQMLTKGQVWAVWDDHQTLWLEAQAFQSDMGFLQVGPSILVTISEKTWDLPIDFISSVMNPLTRTQTIRATFLNSEHRLFPGMIADVRVFVERKGVLTIPKSAVLWTGKHSYVYVKQDDTKYVIREITTGSENESYVEITSGLSEGEEVVVNGVFKLDSAAQLAGKASMMNQPEMNELEHTSQNHQNIPANLNLSERQTEAFIRVLDAYFQVKDALVQSDAELATTRLVLLKNRSDIRELNEIPNWSSFQNTIKKMNQTNDLGFQRALFIGLSDQLIAFVKRYKSNEIPVFVQFCPMADNDKGANWLSKASEIRNPYYGNMMLTCGEVLESLKPEGKQNE